MLRRESKLRTEFATFIKRRRANMEEFRIIVTGKRFICRIVMRLGQTTKIATFVFQPGEQSKKLNHKYHNGTITFFFDYEDGQFRSDKVVQVIEEELDIILIGFRRELVVVEYFRKLARVNPEIRNIRLSNMHEDHEKIDIVVTTAFPRRGSVDVPVQVKGTELNQLDHMRSEKGSRIPSIIIPSGLSYDRLASRMYRLLKWYVTRGEVLHISVDQSRHEVTL